MLAAGRAYVELGSLDLRPRQARGRLVLPLLARAGSTSDVAAFGFVVACTGFRTNQHRTTSTRCTHRYAALRKPAAGRACAEPRRLATHPRQACSGLVSPLLARAGSDSNVAAFGSAVACTRFRTNQYRTTSTRFTQHHAALRRRAAGRACVELGRLASRPRQARGGLVSPLLARAGSTSDVAAFVFVVACTGFRTNQHRTTSTRFTQRYAALRRRAAGRACVELGRLAHVLDTHAATWFHLSLPVLARFQRGGLRVDRRVYRVSHQPTTPNHKRALHTAPRRTEDACGMMRLRRAEEARPTS